MAQTEAQILANIEAVQTKLEEINGAISLALSESAIGQKVDVGNQSRDKSSVLSELTKAQDACFEQLEYWQDMLGRIPRIHVQAIAHQDYPGVVNG